MLATWLAVASLHSPSGFSLFFLPSFKIHGFVSTFDVFFLDEFIITYHCCVLPSPDDVQYFVRGIQDVESGMIELHYNRNSDASGL